MKWHCLYLLALSAACWLGLSAAMRPGVNQADKKRYSITESSKLYLTGTTNVNSFTCDCQDRFVTQVLDVESSGDHASFQNTRLNMATRKFNCHNAKMDRDMQKALKAEAYPNIQIELLETWHNPDHAKNGNNNWFDVRAKVKLTISGVTKVQFIQAQAKALAKNRFALQGEKALQMTSFGIDPPEAVFGLIKVNDWITFHFDLVIQVEDELD